MPDHPYRSPASSAEPKANETVGPPSAEDLVHAVLLATGGLGVVLGVLRPQCTTEMCLGLLVVFFVVRTNLGDRAGLP